MVEDGSLFDRVLVVSFTPGSKKPEVTYRFPPPLENKKDEKDSLADSVSEFCYPETHSDLVAKVSSSNYASETFSFVLTDSLGGKTYGYCRRFKTENDQLECFCILSHSPSFSLFSQILDIVESRRKVSSTLVFSFLKTVLAQIFPAPGETLSVKTFSSSKNGGMDVYNLTRPADEYLTAFVSFYDLFQALDLEVILKVWEYLLCERRVIFCSKNLGTLSSCIYALCALLYPFSWQHIFIPILPQSLIHFVTAPMPFLVGILSSSKSTLNGFPLDEVIMLDLDEKEFTLDHPFEKTLPLPQFCTLKNNLRKLLRSGKKDKEFDQDVAHYFLLFFYTIFRDYKKYISPAKPEVVVQEDVKEATNPKKKPVKRRTPKGDFDRAGFLKSHTDESTQKFLELFGSSQMFESFIQEREEMAGVGSGPIKDCHFLTLCSDTLSDNEFSGMATCEKCLKQAPLKLTCAYDNHFFHPPCFVCKRCNNSMVYDDFNAFVVQITGTRQESSHKVRLVCASCESQGGSGSSGGGATNFLKRMKNAVAHKMEVTSPKPANRLNMFKRQDKKEELHLDKPTTPPPQNVTSPPAPIQTSASTPSAAASQQAPPTLVKSHSSDNQKRSVSPKPLPSAPRPIRNKLVPPNPALFNDVSPNRQNGSANGQAGHSPNTAGQSESVASSASSSSSSSSGSHSDAAPDSNKPQPPTKPKSNSGSGVTTPSQTSSTTTATETKPKSGSFSRTQPTVPLKPRSGSGPTVPPTTTTPTVPATKPRSGSDSKPLPTIPTLTTPHEPTFMSQHRSTSNPNVPANQASSTQASNSSTTPSSSSTTAASSKSPVKPPVKQVPVTAAPPTVAKANATNTTTPPSQANKNKLHPAPAESRPTHPTPVPNFAVKISRPVPPTRNKNAPDKKLQTSDILLDEPPAPGCARCSKPFIPDSDSPDATYRIISTNDAYFHPECFLCKECGKVIETSYVTRDGNSYHRDCAATIAQTCQVCNKPILSQYLELLGKVLHKECFTCVSCKEPLAKVGSKYVELDGSTYCIECTKTRSSTKQ